MNLFLTTGSTPFNFMPKINEDISNMVNESKEDAVIIYYLHDHYNMTLSEARTKLKEAKMWMDWYAHKSNKERFIEQYAN